MNNGNLRVDADGSPQGSIGTNGLKTRRFSQTISNPNERRTLQSLGPIPSYRGRLPSPFPMMHYKPAFGEPSGRSVNQRQIRRWAKDASKYHEIPYEMLAVVLQQENAPNAGFLHKLMQFGERSSQAHIQDLNKRFGNPIGKLDALLGNAIPDGVYRGSSGLMNMSLNTLKGAAEHSERFHKRPPVPERLRIRQGGYDSDTRIPGADWRSDLYYGAAHIRELFDRYRQPWRPGQPLDLEIARKVFSGYNGSGIDADKYGDDAMRLLRGAALGKRNLYFYEQ